MKSYVLRSVSVVLAALVIGVFGVANNASAKSKKTTWIHRAGSESLTQLWQAEIKKAKRQKKQVVVLFTADWCAPCKAFEPCFEAAADENPDVLFAKMNSEEEHALTAYFSIRTIPSVMVFREQVLLFNEPGAMDETAIAQLLNYIKDKSDKHNERFFEVSFDRGSAITPIPILVQVTEQDDGRMQVHTDAFLDLYNDEMALFGAVPIKGERTFHTIADAYKRCFEDNIPGSANKSYIKLRQHEQVTPRLQAYFEKSSEIATQLSQPNGLPWGRSGICTVTVKWNTDHPGRPYVELIRIDGFTWGP